MNPTRIAGHHANFPLPWGIAARCSRLRLPLVLFACAGLALLCGLTFCPLNRANAAATGTSTKEAPARAAMRLRKAECFACHNQEKKKGGLVLTSRERLLEGGDDGAVVEPGKPEASRLAKALMKDADPHMPPKKQLTEVQIKTIRDWIKGGLVWNEAALEEEDAIVPVQLEGLPPLYQPVLAIALSPDGGKLAVGRGGSIVIHDASTTNFPVVAQFEAHRDAVQSLAWSSDGRWLASGGFRRAALWNGQSCKLEHEWTNGLAGRITAIKFLPNGDTFVLADGVQAKSGFLRLCSLAEPKIVASWRAHEDTIFDMDLSRDGKQLVTAGGDKLIKVWDLATQKELARLESHTAQVLAVAFNTNATQVASGGADKQLKVWDIETRHVASMLGKHSAAITAIGWPGDGKTIVAGTDAGAAFTYKNLKAHTGRESSESADERKLGETGDAVLCLAVATDAKRIFAGSHEGIVQVWNGEGKLLAKLEDGQHFGGPNVTTPPINQTGGKQLRTAGKIPRQEPRLEPISLKRTSLISLSAEPSEIRLSADAPRHGVLVTAQTGDGFDIDVTGESKFSASGSAPFEITPSGEVLARRPGQGVLTAQFKGKRVQIPVNVQSPALSASSPAPASVSFLRDVLPALSKAGCNAGACHAKPEGQNGFKLSVFSYDPRSDYAEIVKEDRGRRIFPAAPDESLIIKKPTTALPHEGGLRFERGSETHQLLTRWLREGMAYSLTNEPTLRRITVFPKERRYRKGAAQRLLVQAHYSDGTIRDVTRLAGFDSNDKEIAKLDDH